MLLCSSINSVDVMESPSDSDYVVVDDVVDLLSDLLFPTPAIKGMLSSEWVVNFPRWRMMKESLSGMLSCLAKVSTCLMAVVDNGIS